MFAVNSVMREVVKEKKWSTEVRFDKFWILFLEVLEKLKPSPIVFVFSDFGKNLQLIQGRLRVGLFTSLDFHCRVLIGNLIVNQPDSREVPPAKFLHNDVFLIKLLPKYDRMVPFRAVVCIILTFRLALEFIGILVYHIEV